MYKHGVIPSPPDERNYHVSALIPVTSKHEEEYTIPDFDKIPVYNQENIESCWAHTTATEREYTEWKQTSIQRRMSVLFAYGNRPGYDYKEPGLIPHQSLKRLQDRGICPYDILPGNIEVPEAIEVFEANLTRTIEHAKPHRITSYAGTRSNEEIKSAIRLNIPVKAVIPIYPEFYQLNQDNYIMGSVNSQLYGYHGVILYGWDKQGWKMRNSWGESWGKGGNCILAYDFPITEAWIVGDLLNPSVKSTLYNRTNKKIVVHHLGDGKDTTEHLTTRWNPFGYQYPNYDYGINGDGKVIQGRPLTYEGAHSIATYQKYITGEYAGFNWWNRNSIGVVLSGDFTVTSLPEVMRESLINLLVKLVKEHNLTISDVLPHKEITATACPGTSWSWDSMIKEVAYRLEVNTYLDNLVIYADGDTGTALILSQDLGCPMVHKKDADNYKATNKHWLGVHGINGNGNYYYFGANRKETAKKVLLLRR